MTRPLNMRYLTPLVLVSLMLMLALTPIVKDSLEESPIMLPTEGRQELDVDCSGYTFEHLFEYDFALFELAILDDWATGDMYANAWVNGSNSPIVRDNLDGLFEGAPGGDNEWISTDERDAVRAIGPKCIADMETRLGLREGLPHSGNVDWNDFEFVEDGIALDEVNLVPEDHAESRTCTNLGAAQDCKEVPTYVTDDMEINLGLTDGESNNVRFDQLPNQGVSNFTLGLNITNMSNAALVVTFPVLQSLSLYDSRVIDNDLDGDETTNDCAHIGKPSSNYLPNGALQVTQLVEFDRTLWELECYLFMDFTTEDPPNNDPPEWSDEFAPLNGTKFVIDGQERLNAIAEKNEWESWANDKSAFKIECNFSEEGWQMVTTVKGDLRIELGQAGISTSSSAECGAVDNNGVWVNETRTWEFGTLFTSSANVAEDGNQVILTITPTGFVDSFIITPRSMQGSTMGPESGSGTVEALPVELLVSLVDLRPGAFTIEGDARASNMRTYNFILDLGVEKPNSPPTISVAVNLNGDYVTWDDNGLKFSMYGLASDPDGEGVELSLNICGANAANFDQTNINWEVEVSIAICMANELTTYDVTLTATDDSGASTSIVIEVSEPNSLENNVDKNAGNTIDGGEGNGSLPSLSMMSVIAMIGCAFILSRREDE